ncbi:hypothetical protein ACOJBM_02865 [Rhizobium beringeri]
MTLNNDTCAALGASKASGTEVEEESVSVLPEDVSREKDNAHESRAVIPKRLDEQSRQIHHSQMTVTVSSNIDGHIDEEIKTLKETLEKIHGGSHHSRSGKNAGPPLIRVN